MIELYNLLQFASARTKWSECRSPLSSLTCFCTLVIASLAVVQREQVLEEKSVKVILRVAMRGLRVYSVRPWTRKRCAQLSFVEFKMCTYLESERWKWELDNIEIKHCIVVYGDIGHGVSNDMTMELPSQKRIT